MKKTCFVSMIIVMASRTAYAKAGAGSDGFFFIISVALLTLVIAALLKGTDLIIRNRKRILPLAKQHRKRFAAWLRRHFDAFYLVRFSSHW